MKQKSDHIFLIAKDYRTMASGWQVAPYSPVDTAGSWFFRVRKPGAKIHQRFLLCASPNTKGLVEKCQNNR